MRASLIAATAAATLAVLAGCGQGADPAGGQAPERTSESSTAPPMTFDVTPTLPDSKLKDPGDPTKAPAPPVSIEPTGPAVPPGVKQVPATQVDASAVPEYYDHRGLVWAFDDGQSLQMFAMASTGCGDAVARVTGETPAEVRIELSPLDQPQGGKPDDRMCATVLTPRPVTVALDAPLGNRTVRLSASP